MCDTILTVFPTLDNDDYTTYEYEYNITKIAKTEEYCLIQKTIASNNNDIKNDDIKIDSTDNRDISIFFLNNIGGRPFIMKFLHAHTYKNQLYVMMIGNFNKFYGLMILRRPRELIVNSSSLSIQSLKEFNRNLTDFEFTYFIRCNLGISKTYRNILISPWYIRSVDTETNEGTIENDLINNNASTDECKKNEFLLDTFIMMMYMVTQKLQKQIA